MFSSEDVGRYCKIGWRILSDICVEIDLIRLDKTDKIWVALSGIFVMQCNIPTQPMVAHGRPWSPTVAHGLRACETKGMAAKTTRRWSTKFNRSMVFVGESSGPNFMFTFLMQMAASWIRCGWHLRNLRVSMGLSSWICVIQSPNRERMWQSHTKKKTTTASITQMKTQLHHGMWELAPDAEADQSTTGTSKLKELMVSQCLCVLRVIFSAGFIFLQHVEVLLQSCPCSVHSFMPLKALSDFHPFGGVASRSQVELFGYSFKIRRTGRPRFFSLMLWRVLLLGWVLKLIQSSSWHALQSFVVISTGSLSKIVSTTFNCILDIPCLEGGVGAKALVQSDCVLEQNEASSPGRWAHCHHPRYQLIVHIQICQCIQIHLHDLICKYIANTSKHIRLNEERPRFPLPAAPDGGDNEAQIRGGDAIWPTDLRADFGQGRRHQILKASRDGSIGKGRTVNFQHATEWTQNEHNTHQLTNSNELCLIISLSWNAATKSVSLCSGWKVVLKF